MKNRKNIYRGYISSNEIAGQKYPQKIQNLVLRDFAEKNGLLYQLSATEFHWPKSQMVLKSLLDELSQIDGLLFFSIWQLPEMIEDREEFYQKIISLNKKVHFCYEEMVLSTLEDAKKIEFVFFCKKVVDHNSLTGLNDVAKNIL